MEQLEGVSDSEMVTHAVLEFRDIVIAFLSGIVREMQTDITYFTCYQGFLKNFSVQRICITRSIFLQNKKNRNLQFFLLKLFIIERKIYNCHNFKYCNKRKTYYKLNFLCFMFKGIHPCNCSNSSS